MSDTITLLPDLGHVLLSWSPEPIKLVRTLDHATFVIPTFYTSGNVVTLQDLMGHEKLKPDFKGRLPSLGPGVAKEIRDRRYQSSWTVARCATVFHTSFPTVNRILSGRAYWWELGGSPAWRGLNARYVYEIPVGC